MSVQIGNINDILNNEGFSRATHCPVLYSDQIMTTALKNKMCAFIYLYFLLLLLSLHALQHYLSEVVSNDCLYSIMSLEMQM